MLVLTRRIGEEIVIGGDIRIRITAISSGKVRLGVTAPPSVRVDRAEIHQRRGVVPACRGVRQPDAAWRRVRS
jgi:carbon storage regulator